VAKVIRNLLSCFLLLAISLPTFSQQPSVTPKPEIVSGANKTDGLELPADQTVKFDEGFVTIQATCKGEVKWLVISAVKIKYFTLNTNNTIIVSVPPQGGLISVFAVGSINGKMTEFAKTMITVTTPGPNPTPNPNPINGPLHVTFIMDLNNTTPALGQIINSQKIRDAVTTKNAFYRLYDSQSPILKNKGLADLVTAAGGPPMIVIQTSSGGIVDKRKMPGTEDEIIQYLNQVLGGK
jgi:hypothetical protein